MDIRANLYLSVPGLKPRFSAFLDECVKHAIFHSWRSLGMGEGGWSINWHILIFTVTTSQSGGVLHHSNMILMFGFHVLHSEIHFIFSCINLSIFINIYGKYKKILELYITCNCS